MINPEILSIIAIIAFILHGIYLYKLMAYLRKAYRSKWEEITPERFMGIKREDVPIGNYFKEMKFVLNFDNLNDPMVASLKWKIRVFLFISILLLIMTSPYY